MTKRTAPKTWLASFALVGCALSLAGCGHRATAEDCERIVVRITELELREADVSDPEKVSSQIAKTKETFAESTAKDCVGRRIDSDTLGCVDRATTSRQIVEECFD